MGDTGSLALGGYVAAIAFVLKMPIFIVIVAFIYLIEVISVMMQVTWFKYTKKKYTSQSCTSPRFSSLGESSAPPLEGEEGQYGICGASV